MRRFTVLLSAYAVHPYPDSSEAVANGNLVEALASAGWRVRLATSAFGFEARGSCREAPEVFACEAPRPGPFARLLDRARGEPSSARAWARRAARRLSGWIATEKRPVLWARATPPESFLAALLAVTRTPCALVANYNDPVPRALLSPAGRGFEPARRERWQRALNRRLAAACEAWTFPCRRLAELMAGAAGLDRRRCFVVPHTAPPPAPRREPRAEPRLTYLGRFYGAHFTPAVRAGIERYASGRPGLKLRFVLKRPAPEAARWVRSVPEAELIADATPAAADRLREDAAALLVISPAAHAPLLPTKVVEAVSSGKPVVALAAPGTTTADCVARCGGVVADPGDAGAVADALGRVGRDAPEPDRTAIARFERARIAEDAATVLSYAYDRFAWRQAGTGPEPEPPQLEPWP